MRQSVEQSYVAGRDVKPLRMTAQDVKDAYADLPAIGIDIPMHMVRKMMSGMQEAGIGMDSLPSDLTTMSVGTPIQFLQNWLAGFVNILTAARKIDEIAGVMTAATWEDEEIVQGIMEQTGTTVPYADLTNVPFSSWNVNFVRRTIVRGEEGMRVGVLEEARAARMKVNSAEAKREGASLALEIFRNNIGFNGYNSGANLTYGLLNDPSLGGYIANPSGVWASATYLEIVTDLLTAFATLRNQTGDQVDPKSTPCTLVLPTACVDYLSTVSQFGNSVNQWLKENYPQVRVVSCPQFNAANGGANVFYLFADAVSDNSTDGGRTLIQVVPARFRVVGVEKLAKGYQEDYSNATAGIMVKRPYAVVRYTGI